MSDQEYDDDAGAEVIPLHGGIVVPYEFDDYVPATTRQQAIITPNVLETQVVPPWDDMRHWLRLCREGIAWRRHKAGVHVARAWLYVGRASRFAPRGARMAIARWWRWVSDIEGLLLRRNIAADNSIDSAKQQQKYQAAFEFRQRLQFIRSMASLVVAAAAVIGARYLERQSGPWVLALIALSVLVALGIYGADPGQIVTIVDVPPEVALTADRVINGFNKGKITKPDDPVSVIGVPHEDAARSGWLCDVRLPEGLTVSEVVKKQKALASGLDYPSACLEIDPMDIESERRLGLYVAKIHPLKRELPPWPLFSADRHNIFRPLTIGWDVRGREVGIHLLWLHTLIGSAPRKGKSTLLRLISIGTLMDPRADLIVVDFGGGLDFSAFEPHAREFICGPELEQIMRFMDLLAWLDAEYKRRMAGLRAAGTKLAPKNRITEHLAARAAFRPIVVVVDEFQIATMSTLGKKIVTAWSELAKVCPKVGIILIGASQNFDEDAVPTQLRNIFFQRLALSLATYQASMAVLGNEAQSRGLDAAELGGTPGYGIAWGSDSEEGDGFKGRLRFAQCEAEDAEAMMHRIAAVRAQAGVHIETRVSDLQEPAEIEVAAIVEAALRVWPRPEMNCHQDVLAGLLRMEQAVLGKQMADAGITADPVRAVRPDGSKKPQRGYRLVDLEAVTRGPLRP